MVSPNGDAFACPISEIDEPPGAQKNQARTETRLRVDLDAEDLRRFAKHQAELAMSDGSPRTRRARRRQRVRETLSTVAEEPAVSDRSATAIPANNMTYATKEVQRLKKYRNGVAYTL